MPSSPTTIRVSAPASPKKRKGGGKRRRSSGGGSIMGFNIGHGRTAILVGSAALGYATQQKWLEKLPLLGKAGPITSFGLLGWGAEEILKMRLPPILQNAVTAALSISAFNIGLTTGKEGGPTIVGQEPYYMPGGAVFFD